MKNIIFLRFFYFSLVIFLSLLPCFTRAQVYNSQNQPIQMGDSGTIQNYGGSYIGSRVPEETINNTSNIIFPSRRRTYQDLVPNYNPSNPNASRAVSYDTYCSWAERRAKSIFSLNYMDAKIDRSATFIIRGVVAKDLMTEQFCSKYTFE